MWGSRCMIVVVLLIPSLTFLIFHQATFMPMLYIIQFLSQNMLYPTIILHSGMNFPPGSKYLLIVIIYSNITKYSSFARGIKGFSYSSSLVELAGTVNIWGSLYHRSLCHALLCRYQFHLFSGHQYICYTVMDNCVNCLSSMVDQVLEKYILSQDDV